METERADARRAVAIPRALRRRSCCSLRARVPARWRRFSRLALRSQPAIRPSSWRARFARVDRGAAADGRAGWARASCRGCTRRSSSRSSSRRRSRAAAAALARTAGARAACASPARGAGELYPRMLRMVVAACLPLGWRRGSAALAFHLARQVGEHAVLESTADARDDGRDVVTVLLRLARRT